MEATRGSVQPVGGILGRRVFHRQQEPPTGFEQGSGIIHSSCRKITERVGGGLIVGVIKLLLRLKES